MRTALARAFNKHVCLQYSTVLYMSELAMHYFTMVVSTFYRQGFATK
jgi:hypothetical protein